MDRGDRGLTFKANIDDLRHKAQPWISQCSWPPNMTPGSRSSKPICHINPRRQITTASCFTNIGETLRTRKIANLLVDHDEIKMISLVDRPHRRPRRLIRRGSFLGNGGRTASKREEFKCLAVILASG